MELSMHLYLAHRLRHLHSYTSTPLCAFMTCIGLTLPFFPNTLLFCIEFNNLTSSTVCILLYILKTEETVSMPGIKIIVFSELFIVSQKYMPIMSGIYGSKHVITVNEFREIKQYVNNFQQTQKCH